MSMGEELRGMVMTFRVSELQMLLGYASQNKTGRKSELQARALALLKNKSVPHLQQIHAKIRELYKTIQQGAGAGEVTPSSLLANSTQRSGQSSSTTVPPQSAGIPPPQTQSTPVSSTPLNSQPITNSFMSLSQNRQNMYGSMYGYQQQQSKVPQPGVPMSFPAQVIHPEVTIKRLPFYDILAELVKPSSLAGNLSGNPTPRGHESSFLFYLSPTQASAVSENRDVSNGKSDYPIQIQLRFCLLETTTEQEDIFPPGINVKVNGKQATLPNPIPTNRPGVEPKRPPRPVNISPLCKLCPFEANHIKVSWTPDYSSGYVLVLHLVRKLSANDLFRRLKSKGARDADCTKGLIKEKFNKNDSDCEIATTSLRVSLLCPLGKMKMTSPARSSLCSHLQCFDASLYLQMNEKRPTWTCPVCDKPIPYDSLVIDGYFQDVLNSESLPSEQHEVQLLKDGSWACPAPAKEKVSKELATDKTSQKEVIEEILDDLEDEVKPVAGPSVVKKDEKKEDKKKMIEIDLTASDSDVEEHPAPPTNPATSLNSHHTLSEGSNSSAGARSLESSVIMLDSPSPPESRATTPLQTPSTTILNSVTNTNSTTSVTTAAPSLPVSNHHLTSYSPNSTPMYPQIIQGAGENTNGRLVMQIRMPPPNTKQQNHGRYHPY